MNEVTKIHLGRQAFTISADAYHELKTYLNAIGKQVDDQDVVDEIEIRMAELLTEHGLTTTKVILPNDVEYLKEQLGNPRDFKEDEDDESTSQSSDSKRLFRDTNNAMIAGVAAGLAQYFAIDVLIVRALFVVLVFVTIGWAILLYVLLWLLVPEAKTPSERLQMEGKPVNVSSLKEIVEKADVRGAAHRANTALAGPINRVFNLALKAVGLFFILSGLTMLFGLITGGTYFFAHGATWVQSNIFPVGFREHLLLDIAIAISGLIALFLILFGVAMFRRKWPIKTWVTGILVGLVFIGFAVGGALAADVYPDVRDAYNANMHTTIRSLKPFKTINLSGDETGINFQYSTKNYVSLHYYDHPNLKQIKTTVQNGTLTIDTSQFDWRRNCHGLCIPNDYNLSITVYSPNATQLENQDVSLPLPDEMPAPTVKTAAPVKN